MIHVEQLSFIDFKIYLSIASYFIIGETHTWPLYGSLIPIGNK